MGFHRLVTPTYTGGLPAGYDLINSGAAPADGAKVGGPNEGTYFHAFGEDARALNFNRPGKALAENTDYLDNLLRRDLAIVLRTADTSVSGSPVGAIIMAGPGVFVGSSGGIPLNTLFEITDENDVEITDDAGQRVVVASLTGASVGDGFTAGGVTLNVTPSIAIGKTFRVYYGSRSNLAVMPADAVAPVGVRAMRHAVPGVFAGAGFQNTRTTLTLSGSGALATQDLSWTCMWYEINATYTGATKEVVFDYSGTVRPGATYYLTIDRADTCTIDRVSITASGVTNVISASDKILQVSKLGPGAKDLYIGYAFTATTVVWTAHRF